MTTLRLASALLVCSAIGVLFAAGHSAAEVPTAAPVPAPAEQPQRLVAHEWGTFTSFSGSDGVPVGFTPNNSDLPNFVYAQIDENSKSGRLYRDGTVSMETPVVYFYADHDVRVSLRVDFPKGWITEWYPFAAGAPIINRQNTRAPGQSIRWDVRLTPNETVRFPIEKKPSDYYHARETDSAPLQTEVIERENDRDTRLQGGTILQREKFLFYRGVGTFPPPASIKALGGGKVQVRNASGGKLDGLVLLSVHGGKIGFRHIGSMNAGVTTEAILPTADGTSQPLADLLVKELTAAGLYPKEALAMVKTWDAAWFHEEGDRLLYLVPRAKTDELLPLAMSPKPTELVRVLVGRHDFLTPEQEANADRQVTRIRAAREELNAADQELRKIGRFYYQAERMATQRLEARSAGK